MTKLRFLVDESVGNKLANLLKNSGYDIIFVGNVIPEVDDVKVLSFAKFIVVKEGQIRVRDLP